MIGALSCLWRFCGPTQAYTLDALSFLGKVPLSYIIYSPCTVRKWYNAVWSPPPLACAWSQQRFQGSSGLGRILSSVFKNHLPPFCCAASRRVASCSSSVSTSDAGSWTYLITDPRMKQFFTDCCAGNRHRSEGDAPVQHPRMGHGTSWTVLCLEGQWAVLATAIAR